MNEQVAFKPTRLTNWCPICFRSFDLHSFGIRSVTGENLISFVYNLLGFHVLARDFIWR